VLEEAPGQAAIDAALAKVYGGREPSLLYKGIPDEDPLQGIAVFDTGGHWHYVSYGLSELYEKETAEADVSGFGFELTLRVKRGSEAEPPVWGVDFLQNLAGYVFDTGNVLDVNHQFATGGPIARGEDTHMTAILLARDPQLPVITTPFGRVDFLQIVGVTDDEYELTKDWGTEPLLGALAERDPLLVTDLHRASILADPARAAELRARVEQEGSSLGGVFVAHATFAGRGDQVTLELGGAAVDDLLRLLKGRTLFGREFFVKGDAAVIWVRPAEDSSVAIVRDQLVIRLTTADAEKVRATLKTAAGRYILPSLRNLIIEVPGD
jgi:hypothetical protein